MRLTLIVLGIAGALGACSQSAPTPTANHHANATKTAGGKHPDQVSQSSGESQDHAGSLASSDAPQIQSDEHVTNVQAPASAASGSSSGPKLTAVTPDGAGGASQIVYPTSTFNGHGTLKFVDQSYDVSQQLRIVPSDTQVVVTVLSASSSESDVNDGLQAGVGPTTFARVDAGKANIPLEQRFLMFADNVQSKGGQVSFSAPLPIAVFPADKASRYDTLAKGPLSFSATATGGNGQTFTVNVQISGAASGTTYVVTSTANIPEDKDGTLYQLIGIAPTSATTIDLSQNMIVAMANDLFYHTDKTPGNPFDQMGGLPSFAPPELQQQAQEMSNRQPMHVDYALCQYQASGTTSGPGC